MPYNYPPFSGILGTGTGGGGGGGAPVNATYLTLSLDATLTGERVFTVGTGLSGVDGGAGGNYTLSLANIAGVSGSYTYAAITVDGQGRITAAANGTTPAPAAATFLTLTADATLTNERLFTPGTGLSAVDAGAGGNYTLNLANTTVAAGAYTYASITVDAQGRLTSAANGTTPAPVGATYLVVSLDGTLTNERVLTAGTGISFTDGGAGGNFTINATSPSGWTDDGTTVRLTTSTDVVSIGNNTGTAGRKLTVTNTGTDYGYRGIGAASGDNILDLVVSGDTNARLAINANGDHLWGSGSGVGDARLYRVSAGLLQVDNGAGSAAALSVKGTTTTQARVVQQVTTAASPYAALATDDVIFANPGAAQSITLPAVSAGRRVTVKRINNSANVVTVSPASGTIDGAVSVALAGGGYDAVTVVCDGTNWWII